MSFCSITCKFYTAEQNGEEKKEIRQLGAIV